MSTIEILLSAILAVLVVSNSIRVYTSILSWGALGKLRELCDAAKISLVKLEQEFNRELSRN